MNRVAVMFDLDGTLADTLADIAAGGNAVLAAFDRPTRPADDYRTLAGQGVGHLVKHALGDEPDEATVRRGVEIVRQYHTSHQHEHTRPYPGIAQLLDALTQRQVPLTVLTNKPQDLAEHVIDTLYARWRFAQVRGASEGVPLKPDPAAARAIAERVAAERWVYVGDSDVDMRTGKAAGFLTVGVTWGFREEAELRGAGADAIIHEPMRLLDLL